MNARPARSHRLPVGIWALGLVSLLMDVSSELIHSLLPVFLFTVLGTSMLTIGLLEGAAEATALIVKFFSGALSDRWGRRKPLVLLGYGLGALSKPLFALATGTGLVVAARLIDRVGKGVRGAPRDALVADIAPKELRGAAYGLRQALDTVGAFLGPLLAIGLMLLLANDIRTVFWFACFPAGLCLLVLWFGVKEPDRVEKAQGGQPLQWSNLRRLGPAYWWVVQIGALFTLARFSEAFLVLRGQQGGLDLAWTPLVLIAMNIVYSVGAYPLGKLADTSSHRSLLAAGLVALMAADALLALAGSGPLFWAGAAIWGLHMALTQGLLATMVSEAAPSDLRGTAFGIFYLVSGMATLLASAAAGWLWDRWGAASTFQVSLGLAALALLALLLRPRAAATMS